MKLFTYQTLVGDLAIAEKNGCITHVFFQTEDLPAEAEIEETDVLQEAARQLEQYFAGELQEFDLPLAPEGTEFRKDVWNALCDVPYGRTASYKDIATAVGNDKASRAVGLANNKNPIPIIVPCHRVIGSDGQLVGYAGGLDLKKQLLELEQRHAQHTV